jgi:hypothetical protein
MEGGVEFVGGNGVGMGLHVRAHVKNSTVKGKVILETCYLIPGITNDVEGFEGLSVLAWVHSASTGISSGS